MAETVVLKSLSYQTAGAPLEADTSLDSVHDTGLDTNGVVRERIRIWAYNTTSAERTLQIAVTGSTPQVVVKIRPNSGPVVVLEDVLMPSSTASTTWSIACVADASGVYVSGLVHQYLDQEV